MRRFYAYLLILLASSHVISWKFLFSSQSSPEKLVSKASIPEKNQNLINKASKFLASVSLIGSFPLISDANLIKSHVSTGSQLLSASTEVKKQVVRPKVPSRAQRLFNNALSKRDKAKEKLEIAKSDLVSLKTNIKQKLYDQKSLSLKLSKFRHEIDNGKISSQAKVEDAETTLKDLLSNIKALEAQIPKQGKIIKRQICIFMYYNQYYYIFNHVH